MKGITMRTSYIVFEVDDLRRLNDAGQVALSNIQQSVRAIRHDLGKPEKLSVVVLAPEIVQFCQDFLQEHAKKY